MIDNILWGLIFIGFAVYLAFGAVFTDVILPKFPKLERFIDKLIGIDLEDNAK